MLHYVTSTLVTETVRTVGQMAGLPERKKELERNYGSAKISTASKKGLTK